MNDHPKAATRVAWIDVCRGIGITLVVIGHNLDVMRGMPSLHYALYLFHVPLFFYLTGLTLQPASEWSVVAKRAGRILVPYLLLSLLTLPFAMREFPGMPLSDIALGIVYGSGYTIGNIPLWFLPCMTLALIIALGVIRMSKTWMITSLMVILIAGGAWWMNLSQSHLIRSLTWGSLAQNGPLWSADIALLAAGYMLAGYLMSNLLQERSQHLPTLSCVLVTGVAVIWLAARYELRSDLNMRLFTPVWLTAPVAMAGIVAAIAAAMLLATQTAVSNWLQITGRSSLVILGLHSYIQQKAGKLAAIWLDQGPLLWLFAIACGILAPICIDLWVIRRINFLNRIFYPRF
ncbi:MAG: acyltransferase family protein [Steroidobacteraceae bacterium]